MTFLVDGTHRKRVGEMVTVRVPNWFSSNTGDLIGVGDTGKHSRCIVGLMIRKTLPVGRIFSVGRHSSTGTGPTWAFTGAGANSSCSMTGGGVYWPEATLTG